KAPYLEPHMRLSRFQVCRMRFCGRNAMRVVNAFVDLWICGIGAEAVVESLSESRQQLLVAIGDCLEKLQAQQVSEPIVTKLKLTAAAHTNPNVLCVGNAMAA